MKKSILAIFIGSMFPAIAGASVSVPDIGAMPDQAGLITALNGINPFPATIYNANTATAAATLPASQVMGAQDTVTNMTGTLGAGAALTLPTVAVLLAALTPSQAVLGATTLLRVINSGAGAFSWTVTTATGWTLNGTMTVAQNTWRDFIVQLTNVGGTPTATLQSIGTGTNS